jgi:hypothetical protein
MHLREMPKLTLDDELRDALHRRGDVGEEPGLLAVVEQIEQRAGLHVILVAIAVVEAVRIAGDLQRRLGQIRALDRTVW